MTFKRDIKADRKETNREILKNKKTVFTGESWLGHTKDCGIIDHELLKGATREELAKRSGRELSGVDGHISHLKSEHGLQISKKGNVYKLEFIHPISNKALSETELNALMDLDIEKVVKYCIVQLKNEDNITNWHSIGIEAININGNQVISLDENKNFAQTLLNKKIDDFVNFGNGFKIIAIKKYLSE